MPRKPAPKKAEYLTFSELESVQLDLPRAELFAVGQMYRVLLFFDSPKGEERWAEFRCARFDDRNVWRYVGEVMMTDDPRMNNRTLLLAAVGSLRRHNALLMQELMQGATPFK